MAANDLLTLAEAKTAVNLPAASTEHDDELTLWVSAVSRRIDDLCGPVVARTVTEQHDGGGHAIRPHKTPVSSVTSLTEYDDTTATTLTAETNASKPADGYLLDELSSHNVVIRRRDTGSDSAFPSGRRNVVLVMSAGRYADTASVDELFKLTVGAILRRLWSREQGAWSTGGDPFATTGTEQIKFHKTVDPMVAEFLGHEMHGPGVA